MARRTKEEAMATRESILDAAELLFVQQGVSGTTLQHIASAAGVTRGAIYWHFHDKAAMFNAMMERARMPLESALQVLDRTDAADPLHDLRNYMQCVLRLTVEDPKARRVFEIALLKMELVGELDSVRERRKQNRATWMKRAESRIRLAVKHGQAKRNLAPRAVALGIWAMLEGLIRTWLIDPDSFDLIKLGGQIVDTHIDALRA
jgi:TetR/AcrR family acrAB operon transcriptional repressor